MSGTISNVSAAYVAQAPRPAAVDSDGDNDGSKTSAPAAAPVTPQPQVSKPTATVGNNVNTVA
jgi:hypothetical protein